MTAGRDRTGTITDPVTCTVVASNRMPVINRSRPPSTRETRTIRSRLTWPLSRGSEPVTTSIVGSATTGVAGSVVVVRLHARHRSGCRVRFWPHPEQRNRILLVIGGCDRRDRGGECFVVLFHKPHPLSLHG